MVEGGLQRNGRAPVLRSAQSCPELAPSPPGAASASSAVRHRAVPAQAAPPCRSLQRRQSAREQGQGPFCHPAAAAAQSHVITEGGVSAAGAGERCALGSLVMKRAAVRSVYTPARVFRWSMRAVNSVSKSCARAKANDDVCAAISPSRSWCQRASASASAGTRPIGASAPAPA